MAARIVRVADVYDALISARLYKSALPHEEAVNLIVSGRGKQFDPVMVDAFVEAAPRMATVQATVANAQRNRGVPESLGVATNEQTWESTTGSAAVAAPYTSSHDTSRHARKPEYYDVDREDEFSDELLASVIRC